MIGLQIDGYEIIKFRGQGTFGTVYKCLKDEKEYAIKIFSLQYVFSEFSKNINHNRITQEIDSLARLNHKNIVSIFAHGTFTHLNIEYVYIIMEFLEGNNLREALQAVNKFKVKDVIKLIKQILLALEHIHNNDIIHRDLKPENIFLTNDNIVKVVDFGLSKIIDFSSITMTGEQIGSPLYMSPEQIRDSKNIDYRSDYYALGVIFFELLTGENPYGKFTSREQLYYKIINERPLSVLQYDPSIPNSIDNLINSFLEKSNFRRPNNVSLINKIISAWDTIDQVIIPNFEPTFFLRLYNEKKVLIDFYNDGNHIDNTIFPINHQQRQKGLLKHVLDYKIQHLIDPSTMRLAYDTFADVKGLVSLPYAPTGYDKLELTDLRDLNKKQKYVSLIIDEQLKYKPSAIISPFHVSNNSNIISIKNDLVENWFTIDIKLLKESKDYIVTNNINLPLVGGFCVKTDILTSKEEQEYFLNVLSSLPCDYFLIYVDCIDYNSNSTQLYNYIKTLLLLQNSTGKPVIAGRINCFGLLLLSFGVYGFEAGTARFESFYEGLYSERTEPYNMFVMYYIPELLKNISVKRKDPTRIYDILESESGDQVRCNCPYCDKKAPDELVIDEVTKKHFLYRRQQEIDELKKLSVSDRLDLMSSRIEKALELYKKLKPVFKSEEYAFLNNWKKIIPDLRDEFNL